MGVLNIDDLRGGMVLAENILNKHGNILIKKGNILSEQNVMILKAWGITQISVEGVDQKQVDQQQIQALPAEVVDSIEKELREFFPDYGDNQVMKEIYRVVKKFWLKRATCEMNGENYE